MAALGKWNGGVIIISHDERFITQVAEEVVSSFSNRFNANDIGEAMGLR